MRKTIRLLAIWVSTILPYPVWANLPSQQEVGEGRLQNWRWPFLLEKLAANRMPKAYYEFLYSKGVTTPEQLRNLDQVTKDELLKMYKEDLIVIAGKSGTRSIW